MPVLPDVSNQIRASSLRSGGGLPNTRASGADFGAGIGDALQNVASGIDRIGAGLDVYQEKKRQETVANAVAQSDFTPTELGVRNQVPEDGTGLHDKTLQSYDSYVDEQANKITDDRARIEYKKQMMAQRPAVANRSATFEATLSATSAKTQADASLSSLQNKIMSDPSTYDTYVKQGEQVIDATTAVPNALKAGMKLQWRQDSAKGRFTGMLEHATTVQDIDAAASDLAGQSQFATGPDDRPKDWAKELSPNDYATLVNQMGTARKAIVTKNDTDARAALDTIEARAADLAVIPTDELATVQRSVKLSQNPVTLQRMSRIMRDQEVIKESIKSTPAELQSRINATNGNPNVSYPGTTPQLSSAINDASSKFGVPSSYLGSMVQREYGQYLPKGRQRADAKFNPVPQNQGVDLQDVRSDVLDAATVAGQNFGQPLVIYSGYRSQARQDAIRFSGDPNRASVAKHSAHTDGKGLDISIAGMDDSDLARLAGSLVDAGFTGIGQYPTHIHADFRDAVPKNFTADDATGKYYGGWTNLSPSVAKALVERGFTANAKATDIKRGAQPVPSLETIDFGRGTDIVNEDGKRTSTAVGVAQFTEGTFLQTLKTPGVAAAIGVDVANMSDAQILELRKDPRVSIMASAALAGQNKKAMESALGRTINDSELYMGHFLGAGGATTLIRGLDNQPDQSAALLLPDAAKANHNVFYDKGGKARSVREVYGNLSRDVASQPSNVTYGDNDTRGRVLKDMKTQIATDPATFAQKSGNFTLSGLDTADGFKQRGVEARSIADFYQIPQTDMKPFTEPEADALKKKLLEGTADDALELATSIQNMGGVMAKAALKQLDQKDSVFAYAGGLQLDNQQSTAPSDIIRGQKLIHDNPAIKDQIGATPTELSAAFNTVAGTALFGADPKQRQAMQDAAIAHYVQTSVANGTTPAFDQEKFANSVQAVLGGTKDRPAIATVNGEPTLLPKGLTGDEMETAMAKMTVDDWTAMSEQKTPPRYANGNIIDPKDMADEAKLKAIGNNKYNIMFDDGTFAVTGRTGQNNRLEAYIFVPDANQIESIAAKADAAAQPDIQNETQLNNDGTLSSNEQKAIENDKGALYNFDEYGRWIGPTKGQ